MDGLNVNIQMLWKEFIAPYMYLLEQSGPIQPSMQLQVHLFSSRVPQFLHSKRHSEETSSINMK